MSISISDARYEEIKEIVINLFVQFGVKCIPINGFELATKMGIKVIPYSAYPEPTRSLLFKESEDGFMVEKAVGEFYIFYNDFDMPYGRINNTILHEIGHIVLDHSEDSDLADKEVNFFAKYAIAPPPLVHKLKATSPSDIKKHFDVSSQAAVYAFEYYQKWLKKTSAVFTNYEKILLNQFEGTG